MAVTHAHDGRGRFASDWSDDQLLDALILVALTVNPKRPTSVPQAAWDDARGPALAITEPTALPPSARAIVMRLNGRGPRDLSWRQWLELAEKEGTERRQSLVAQQRSKFQGPVSDRRVRYALRRIAGELHVETLTPDEYDHGLAQLGRGGQRRQGDNGVVELLPTANQLQQQRSWREALALADLKQPRPRPPARSPPAVRPKGMPAPRAQAWFARYNHRFAAHQVLRRFMTDCNASLADWTKGRPYSECYEEAERILREWGEPVPAKRPDRKQPTGLRTVYQLPPGGVIPDAPPKEAPQMPSEAERRGRCIEALAAFDAHMRTQHPGVRATQKRYLAWQKGRGQWPAPSTFQQFGGFTKLLAEARRPQGLARGLRSRDSGCGAEDAL